MTEKTASEELAELAAAIKAAREAKGTAEKYIEKNMPRYHALLNKVYGKGRVEFEFDGLKYGRTIAEKTKFLVADFVADHPELDFLIEQKTTYTLNEGEAKAYIADHPDVEKILQDYTEVIEEERWKTPVKLKD